jgi:hypothetical protein
MFEVRILVIICEEGRYHAETINAFILYEEF